MSFHDDIAREVARRRTFAIISHPDAGKTTLTEKLLLYGGAVQLVGEVKAKANRRHATSDWMELERQRGISITSSVLPFEYKGMRINLLDTPGHKDFSEDTFRTLTAADAAVMLIDAAKGVEPQTLKLFEVCSSRGLPIFTFFNKLDRPTREPLELIDELEKVLGMRSAPITWPIGQGDSFSGVFDKLSGEVLLFQTEDEANVRGRIKPRSVSGVDDPLFKEMISTRADNADDAERIHDGLRTELELLDVAGDPLDMERVLSGSLTPVFFGSAMNNFGVERFLDRFIGMAPPPGARASDGSPVSPLQEDFSGFFFKIQANMDPNHRDRVAFLRVCSGRFEKNMTAKHVRMGKSIRLTAPRQLFAQDRDVIDEAWPGDIVGLVDTTGDFRIGDTLSSNPSIRYEGVPRFSPEHFASIMVRDAMKRKRLEQGLSQLSEEGVIQVYYLPGMGTRDPYLGAVGALQFEVLKFRLEHEYNVEPRIERLPYIGARWVIGGDFDFRQFERFDYGRQVIDRDGNDVVLYKTEFGLRRAEETRGEAILLATAPI